MKRVGIILSVLVLHCFILCHTLPAQAATDGVYQLSEATSAWDGTDASRLTAPSADYDYTYGDEGSVTYTLPWSFGLYGQSYTQIVADVNGFIRFAAPTAGHSFNLTTTGMGPVIAPWNNDLSSYYYGGVFIQHKTAPERVVVQWQTETYTEEGLSRLNNFEAVLYPDGTIRFDYQAFNTQAGKDFGSGISKGDGTAALSLTAAYGNAYTLAGRSFQFVDTTPPALTVSPANPLVNKPTVVLSGTMSPGCTIGINSTTATIGTVTYPTATSWTATATGLADGANIFTVIATRQSYAVTSTATKTVTLDRSVPSVVINGPSGYVRTATPVLDYTVIDGVVTGVTVDNVATTVRAGQNLPQLGEGPHTVTVTFTDGAGPGSVQSAFTVDTVPPALTITAVASPLTTASFLLSGTVESGLPVTVTASTPATVGTVTTTGGTWSCSVANLPPGDTIFTATAVDPAGNGMIRRLTVTYVPPLTTVVTPAAMAADQTGGVRLDIANIPNPSAPVLVEQYVDANRNGTIDAADYVIRSFSVTDGTASADPGVPGDIDATANGAIAVILPATMTRDLYHAPGAYLFRISQNSSSFVAPFAVTPLAQPQGVSGLVSDGVNPVPGALVRLADTDNRHLAFGIADQAGQYTLNIASPGSYRLTPLAYGYLSPAAAIVNVTAGYTQQDLTLTPGSCHLSGRVKDDTTGAGLAGVWVKATGTNGTALAMSAADGGYDLVLPAGQYDVLVSSDPAEPNPAAAGYLTSGVVQFSVALTGDSGGHDILLPRATARVSGRVVDPVGNGIPGVAVRALLTGDPRQPQSSRVSDANGDYTLPLAAGSAWTLALKEPYAALMGLLGNTVSGYSVGVSPAAGNDLTARPVTAWVQGVVKDSANTLLGGVEVVLRNVDATVTTSVVTAQNGSYRLGAYAGTWHVQPLTAAKGLPAVAEQPAALTDGQTLTLPDFVVDVTPPALAINTVSSPTSASSQTVGGTMEAGAVVAVTVNTAAQVGTVTYPTATTWSCDIIGLAEGTNSITVTATDSSGNRTVATASIVYSPPPFIDLVITNLSGPAQLQKTQTVTYLVTVKNQGTIATNTTTNLFLYLSWSPDFNPPNLVVLNAAGIVPVLAPGAETTIPVSFATPNVSLGTYYVLGYVNAYKTVAEQNTGNNITSSPAVSVVNPPADLVITNVTGQAVMQRGQAATCTVTVKNQGTVATNATTTVQVFLSTTPSFPMVAYLNAATVPVLAPGQEVTLTMGYTTPNVSPGTYYVLGSVNPYQTVMEQDYGNNISASLPLAVVNTPADLVITSLSGPTTLQRGQAVTYTASVKNQGNSATDNATKLFLYLSASASFNPPDVINLFSSADIPVLAPGEVRSFALQFTTPQSTQPGTYYVLGYVNPSANNYTTESDYTNNVTAGPAATVVNPPADLTVTNITGPASLQANQTGTYSVTVRNQGTAATDSATTVMLFLSATDTMNPNVISLNSSAAVPILAPGEERSYSLQFTTPQMSPASYYVLALVNPSSSVLEQDYGNNVKASAPVAITQP